MKRYEMTVSFYAEDIEHASDLCLVVADVFPEGTGVVVGVREIEEEEA